MGMTKKTERKKKDSSSSLEEVTNKDDNINYDAKKNNVLKCDNVLQEEEPSSEEYLASNGEYVVLNLKNIHQCQNNLDSMFYASRYVSLGESDSEGVSYDSSKQEDDYEYNNFNDLSSKKHDNLLTISRNSTEMTISDQEIGDIEYMIEKKSNQKKNDKAFRQKDELHFVKKSEANKKNGLLILDAESQRNSLKPKIPPDQKNRQKNHYNQNLNNQIYDSSRKRHKNSISNNNTKRPRVNEEETQLEGKDVNKSNDLESNDEDNHSNSSNDESEAEEDSNDENLEEENGENYLEEIFKTAAINRRQTADCRKWNEKEDAKLLSGISKKMSFQEIALSMPRRTWVACRSRFGRLTQNRPGQGTQSSVSPPMIKESS